MAFSIFGKKKEEQKGPACGCQGSCQTENQTPRINGDVTSVKVLGSGCKTCHDLYESAQQAVQTMGLPAEVEYITDLAKVMEYGVMSMPALVVNEQVVSMGKTLKPAAICSLLEQSGVRHG